VKSWTWFPSYSRAQKLGPLVEQLTFWKVELWTVASGPGWLSRRVEVDRQEIDRELKNALAVPTPIAWVD